MQNSIYHSMLRTSALTLALILLFVSGLVSPVTQHLSVQTERYLASTIGMYASVEPNGLNEVTAALTAKETELLNRETALNERELSLGLNGSAPTNDYTVYILSVILFILLVLIIANYVLDFLRSRPKVIAPNYGRVA
jgi:hypothetical protein